MKMQNDKLLPCPFCGGEAEVLKSDASKKFPYHVVCKNIDCSAMNGAYSETESDAISKWNTRKPMERIAERLERLDVKGSVAKNVLNFAIYLIHKGGVDNAG